MTSWHVRTSYMARSMWKYIIASSRTPAPRAHNQQLHALSAFVYSSLTLYISPLQQVASEHKCVSPLCSPGAYCVWLDFLQAPIFSDIIQQQQSAVCDLHLWNNHTLAKPKYFYCHVSWGGCSNGSQALIRINSACCGQASVRADSIQVNLERSHLFLRRVLSYIGVWNKTNDYQQFFNVALCTNLY